MGVSPASEKVRPSANCYKLSMQPDPKVVEELARRIVEVAHPLRIVLFGSAARGEMEPDSDIDVLVIVSEGAHRRHTAQSIYRRMIGFPVERDSLPLLPRYCQVDHPGQSGRDPLA